jgi:hypothetical protein
VPACGANSGIRVAAPLWRYPGEDGWHFVFLPSGISADISDITAGTGRGFGSVCVAVTVGITSWRTSVFPDSKAGTYLLPVKESGPCRRAPPGRR